jgi:hypothetical protein
MPRRGLEWGGEVIKRRRESKQLKKGRKDGYRGGGERGKWGEQLLGHPGAERKKTQNVRKGTEGKAQEIGNE